MSEDTCRTAYAYAVYIRVRPSFSMQLTSRALEMCDVENREEGGSNRRRGMHLRARTLRLFSYDRLSPRPPVSFLLSFSPLFRLSSPCVRVLFPSLPSNVYADTHISFRSASRHVLPVRRTRRDETCRRSSVVDTRDLGSLSSNEDPTYSFGFVVWASGLCLRVQSC